MSENIGTSLGKCILHIISGKKNIEEIQKIISALDFRDEKHLLTKIQAYKNGLWLLAPERAESVFHQLRDEGKIEWCRQTRKAVIDLDTPIWVEHEDSIKFWPIHPE